MSSSGITANTGPSAYPVPSVRPDRVRVRPSVNRPLLAKDRVITASSIFCSTRDDDDDDLQQKHRQAKLYVSHPIRSSL